MGLCEESWWSMVFFKSWALRVRSVCATLPISINMRSSSWSWDEWHWSTCGRKHWIPIILAGTMANICGCARHCAWRFLLYHPVSSHSPLGRWGCQLWSSVLCPCWSEADAVWVRQLCYEPPEYPLVLVPPCVHDRIKNCPSASSISSLPSYFSKHYGQWLPQLPWDYSPQGHLDLDVLNTMDVAPGSPFCGFFLWCHYNLLETHPFLVCSHALLKLLLGSF